MLTDKELKSLAISNVLRVYSGKPGCMCGCQGKYWHDPVQISRVLNKIRKAASGELGSAAQASVEIELAHGDSIFCEIGNRVYVAYMVP